MANSRSTVEGDSLAAGTDSVTIEQYMNVQLNLEAPWDTFNVAEGGDGYAGNIPANRVAQVDSKYDAAAPNNNIFVLAGTNDLDQTVFNKTPAELYALVTAYVADSHAATANKLIISTLPHRGDAQASDINPKIDTYNAMCIATPPGDKLFRLDLIPEAQDPFNATYFQPDHKHFKNALNAIIGTKLAAIQNAVTPTADFTIGATIEIGDNSIPVNNSTDAVSYEWWVNGIIVSTEFEPNLAAFYKRGSNEVQLRAYNAVDDFTLLINTVTVNDKTVILAVGDLPYTFNALYSLEVLAHIRKRSLGGNSAFSNTTDDTLPDPPPFVPTDLAQVRRVWVAQDQMGLSDGDMVVPQDSSGRNKHMIQASDPDKPLYKIVGGKPVFWFDGATQNCGLPTWEDFTNGGAEVFICLIGLRDSTHNEGLWTYANSQTYTYGNQIDEDFWFASGRSAAFAPAVDLTTWHLYRCQMSSDGHFKAYLNGLLVHSESGFTAGPPSAGVFGKNQLTGSNKAMYVAGKVVFDGNLSDDDAAKMTTFMNSISPVGFL